MVGSVHLRLRLRARHGRAAAAAGVLAAGLFSVGAVTASAGNRALPEGCSVDLLGDCLLGSGTSGTSTPTPSSSGLCILILCGPGSSSNGTTTPTPTPACTLPACLPVSPNPTCDITTDPTCLLASATPTPCQTNCTASPTGNGTHPPGTSSPGGSSRPRPSSSQSGGSGGLGGDSTTPGPNIAVAAGLNVAAVPVVQQVSPVSGLQFGHAPILWPLFGALDVLGLVAAYFVIRRTRSARID
jgi:hypothetical protein